MLKKISKLIIILVLFALVCFLCVIKYIPSVVDAGDDDEPVFYEFSVSKNNVKIFADFESDLTSFHGYKYEYDGKNLYLKLYAHLYGLHCKKGEGLSVKIDITGDFENLQSIYITDNDKKREIWKKD